MTTPDEFEKECLEIVVAMVAEHDSAAVQLP